LEKKNRWEKKRQSKGKKKVQKDKKNSSKRATFGHVPNETRKGGEGKRTEVRVRGMVRERKKTGG